MTDLASKRIRVARPDSLPPASDRFVVVEASAGTGKTFFLEHRVVDLILGGADLAQILLVTFTDKAVAELRVRIRDLLDRTHAAPPRDREGEQCTECPRRTTQWIVWLQQSSE